MGTLLLYHKKRECQALSDFEVIEVALKEQDCYDNILLEYKVFVLCISFYEAFYKQLFHHEFDNVVFFYEYLLEKHLLLRKVKEFLIKGIIIVVFS